VSQRSLPATASNRKARDARLVDYDALADFVNLGNTSDDWAKICRKWPQFFPPKFMEMIYAKAQAWSSKTNLPFTTYNILEEECYKPFFPRREFGSITGCIREHADLVSLFGIQMYLQGVWRKEHGDPFCVKRPPRGLLYSLDGLGTLRDSPRPNLLDPGPVVRGNPAMIRVEFRDQFQRAIFGLMVRESWRAKVSPECGKYFVAEKTHQKYCSERCFYEIQLKRSAEYYKAKGKFRRQARAVRAKSQRKRSSGCVSGAKSTRICSVGNPPQV